MAALTTLMTRFCAGEDSWLARSNITPKTQAIQMLEISTASHEWNRHKHRNNGENTEDTAVNTGFRGFKSG